MHGLRATVTVFALAVLASACTAGSDSADSTQARNSDPPASVTPPETPAPYDDTQRSASAFPMPRGADPSNHVGDSYASWTTSDTADTARAFFEDLEDWKAVVIRAPGGWTVDLSHTDGRSAIVRIQTLGEATSISVALGDGESPIPESPSMVSLPVPGTRAGVLPATFPRSLIPAGSEIVAAAGSPGERIGAGWFVAPASHQEVVSEMERQLRQIGETNASTKDGTSVLWASSEQLEVSVIIEGSRPAYVAVMVEQ